MRRTVKIARSFHHDFIHVISYQKNAAAAFIGIGLFIGVNIALMMNLAPDSSNQQTTVKRVPSRENTLLLSLLVCLGQIAYWVMTSQALRSWMLNFQADIHHMIIHQTETTLGLLGLGIGLYNLISIISWMVGGLTCDSKVILTRIWLFALVIVTFVATLVQLLNTGRQWKMKWKHIWAYRKNAVFVILVTGALCGALCRVLYQSILSRRRNMMLQFLMCTLLIVPAAYTLSLDVAFMSDLEHVLKLRKNVMCAFGIVGVLTGLCTICIINTCLRPSMIAPTKLKN